MGHRVMFKRRVSYQFGFNGSGEPGDVVTLKADLLDKKVDVFRALKLMISDGEKYNCFKLIREVRFPNMQPAKVTFDDCIRVRENEDNVADFIVPCGITRGGTMEIDVEIPKSKKVVVSIMGYAEGDY
jgi:hypothetical protein